MMRLVFIIMLLAGAALGIAYPWAASNVAGYEIGIWRIYERGSGFVPVEANFAPTDAPVSITVDLRTDRALARGDGKAALFIDVGDEKGATVLSASTDLIEAQTRTVNPQSGETAYRETVATLPIIDRDRYRFTVRAAAGVEERMVSANLILNAGAFDLDPRAVPAGFILMAVGVVGFAASLFRKRREKANSKPPTRWGRGS